MSTHPTDKASVAAFDGAFDTPKTPAEALEVLKAWGSPDTYTFSSRRAKQCFDLLSTAQGDDEMHTEALKAMRVDHASDGMRDALVNARAFIEHFAGPYYNDVKAPVIARIDAALASHPDRREVKS